MYGTSLSGDTIRFNPIEALLLAAALCFLLMASGKSIDRESILVQLRHSEQYAVDGMKALYSSAIFLMSDGKTDYIS
ncbi:MULTISPECIES: hypothetical protein [unclassified Pantoea]|uniref:hypothetical protein n=1 Tax=unclassified Pantoea TaxID=2630326 RepID=UPI00301BAB23